jgi:hypothetical protein
MTRWKGGISVAEYIEREAVLDLLTNRDVVINPNDEVANIREDIECLPAADVRPVVYGRDICDTVKGHCEFKCSVCGVELSSVYGGENDFGLDGGYFRFCPNCGAMMEES